MSVCKVDPDASSGWPGQLPHSLKLRGGNRAHEGQAGTPLGGRVERRSSQGLAEGAAQDALRKGSKLPLLCLLTLEQQTLASRAFPPHFLLLFRNNHAFLLLHHQQQLFAFSSPSIQTFSAGPVILTTVQTGALSRRLR